MTQSWLIALFAVLLAVGAPLRASGDYPSSYDDFPPTYGGFLDKLCPQETDAVRAILRTTLDFTNEDPRRDAWYTPISYEAEMPADLGFVAVQHRVFSALMHAHHTMIRANTNLLVFGTMPTHRKLVTLNKMPDLVQCVALSDEDKTKWDEFQSLERERHKAARAAQEAALKAQGLTPRPLPSPREYKWRFLTKVEQFERGCWQGLVDELNAIDPLAEDAKDQVKSVNRHWLVHCERELR